MQYTLSILFILYPLSPYLTHCLHTLPIVYIPYPLSPHRTHCHHTLPTVSISYPLSPYLTHCLHILPTVSISYPLSPYLTHCLHILPTVSIPADCSQNSAQPRKTVVYEKERYNQGHLSGIPSYSQNLGLSMKYDPSSRRVGLGPHKADVVNQPFTHAQQPCVGAPSSNYHSTVATSSTVQGKIDWSSK